MFWKNLEQPKVLQQELKPIKDKESQSKNQRRPVEVESITLINSYSIQQDMEKEELLKRIWSLTMYPGRMDRFSSIMGVEYEQVETGQTIVIKTIVINEERKVKKAYIEWFDDHKKLDADLVEKVLAEGTEAIVHFSFVDFSEGVYYRGVPVRRKR